MIYFILHKKLQLGFKYYLIAFITDDISILFSTPVQIAMNLHNISAVKNQVTSDFFKNTSGPLSGSIATSEVLTYFILFCFSYWITLKKEESFMKRVSVYLLQIYLLLSNGKERRKSMFSYINKDKDLRNNGMQISLWLRNLKLCFFSLLSMQRTESFSECFVQSKGSMTQNQTMPPIFNKVAWFLKCYH